MLRIRHLSDECLLFLMFTENCDYDAPVTIVTSSSYILMQIYMHSAFLLLFGKLILYMLEATICTKNLQNKVFSVGEAQGYRKICWSAATCLTS